MSEHNSNTRRSRSRSVRRTRRNNSRNTKLLKYDEEIASLRRQISRMNARLLDLENKNAEHIYNTIPELRESSNSNSELEFDLTAGPRPPPLLTPSPSPPLPLPPSSDISPDYSQIPQQPPVNFEALYSGQNSISVGEGPNIYESRFRQPGASARRPSRRPSLRQSSRPSRRNSPNVYESISLPRGISARKSTLSRPSRRPSNIRRNNLGGGSRKTRKFRRN